MVDEDGLFGEVFGFGEEDELCGLFEVFLGLGDLVEAFGAEGVVAVDVEGFEVLFGAVCGAL